MGKRRNALQLITGIEIGTSAIRIAIGELLADGAIHLLGAYERPSQRKVVKGEVVDVAGLQEHLYEAMRATEDLADESLQNFFLAVTGNHIEASRSTGQGIVNAQDPHVDEEAREQAQEMAQNFQVKPDREIFHTFNCQYRVDGREVENPVGQYGSRVEADCLVIHGNSARLQTSRTLVHDALSAEDQEPKGIAFSPVATAMGVLFHEEADKGALVIDIGAGVTEYALFSRRDCCLFAGQVTVGCEHLANDLQLCLKIPMQRARELVMRSDVSAIMTQDGDARLVEFPAGTGKPERQVPMSLIEQVMEMRLSELFKLIRDDLAKENLLARIGFGIKLTGGGAEIPRIVDLARRVFDMPVSIGYPRQVTGKGAEEVARNPRFATVCGLIRFGRVTLDESIESPTVMVPLVDWLDHKMKAAGRGWKSFWKAMRV